MRVVQIVTFHRDVRNVKEALVGLPVEGEKRDLT